MLESIEESLEKFIMLESIEEILVKLKSVDKNVQKSALISLHDKFYPSDGNLLEAEMIFGSKEALSSLVEWMVSDSLFYRTFALNIITSCIKLVSPKMSAGVIPGLVDILNPPTGFRNLMVADIIENIFSRMSNDEKLAVVTDGFFPRLKNALDNCTQGKEELLESATKFLDHISRPYDNPPTLTMDAFKSFLLVVGVILESTNVKIIANVLQILCDLSNSGEECKISEVIATGMVPKVVSFLPHADPNVRIRAVRMVMIIFLAENPQQATTLLEAGVLQHLSVILKEPSSSDNMRGMCFCSLSILNKQYFASLEAIRAHGVIPILVQELREGNPQWQKLTTKGLIHAVCRTDLNVPMAEYFIEQGVVQELMKLAKRSDLRSDTPENAAKALSNLLRLTIRSPITALAYFHQEDMDLLKKVWDLSGFK